jgi:hypothetical protein
VVLSAAFVILIVVLSIYIFAPLFERKGDRELDWQSGRDVIERLLQEKERMYENISELDFEYASGKIADKEYRILREGLVQETVNLLREIDEARRRKGLLSFEGNVSKTKEKKASKEWSEDIVEKEIAKFKKRKKRGKKA